jgi:hypothetical protein
MGRAFAWMSLVLTAGTAAYGLQLTAAALVRPANQVVSTSSTRRVSIVAIEADTGDRIAQVECEVPAYNFTGDVVLVDANELADVSQACADAYTSVMRFGAD